MHNIPEDTIIKAAEGDIEAFEDIYRKSSGFVYTVAYRVTTNREDAEEVTQDVFVSVYRNLKNFKFKSSFKTWAYRITVNTAINLKNRRKRKQGKNVPYEEALDADESVVTGPDAIEDSEREEQIKDMLDSLPQEQRICVVLKDIEGMKYEEIAETLKININTVRSRLKRAREKLISRYGKGGQ